MVRLGACVATAIGAVRFAGRIAAASSASTVFGTSSTCASFEGCTRMPFVVTTNCASWAGVSTTFCFALKNASASGTADPQPRRAVLRQLEQGRDPPPRDPVPGLPESQHHRRRDGRPRLGERGGELRRRHPRLVGLHRQRHRTAPGERRERGDEHRAGLLAVEHAAGGGRDDRQLQPVPRRSRLRGVAGRRPSRSGRVRHSARPAGTTRSQRRRCRRGGASSA